jgi:hypothetical protein
VPKRYRPEEAGASSSLAQRWNNKQVFWEPLVKVFKLRNILASGGFAEHPRSEISHRIS